MAERLEQLGKEIARDDGTVILISDTNFRPVDGELQADRNGEHTLQGRSEQTSVHRPLDCPRHTPPRNLLDLFPLSRNQRSALLRRTCLSGPQRASY